MASDIVYDLMANLKAHLQDKMIDHVPAGYAAALDYTGSDGVVRTLVPSLIKIGRLQDDPTTLAESFSEPSVHVAIHSGDPADLSDGWKHSLATMVEGSMTNAAMFPGSPRELGGGSLWWRRFKVEYRAFFIESDQTEEEAAQLGNMFRGLIEAYCDAWSPANPNGWTCRDEEGCMVEDVFGEVALRSAIVKSQTILGGGPDDDYIVDGEVWLQVMTERQA